MIEYFVMDVDGTLTDGKLYMGNQGEVMKAFDIKDGCGIHAILPELGILPVIITGRTSEIVSNRCKELRIPYYFQGVSDKLSKLVEITGDMKHLSRVAYIGDDRNDLRCMRAVRKQGGLVGCPADAIREVVEVSDFVSEFKGGAGAVRDFIEYICKTIP